MKWNAERYDSWFDRNPHLLESEIAAVRELMPRFDRGMEIGTGTGVFASRLGIREGLEPSAEMGRKAAGRGIGVIRAHAENIPVKDGSYDFALMATVDCFLDDVPRVFRETARILRNNGCFLIAFLDRETALGKIYQQRKFSNEFYRHADLHSSVEIVAMLDEAGFRIDAARQTVFSLENEPQPVAEGTGEGVFAVVRARKR